MSDGLTDLLHLCEIYGLQPILCYMISSEAETFRECESERIKKMREQYIASVYLPVQ